MLIMASCMAYQVSPRLCVIYCVVLPILGIGLYILIRLVRVIFEKAFKTFDKLNNVIQENIHGIRVVKSFVREEKETEKFTAITEELYQDFTKAERIMAFNNPLMQTCVYTCILVISYLGATMVVESGNNPDL